MINVKKIGIIGCGLMGEGMVRNLLQQNFDVFIFDINEAMTIPLVEAGAKKVESISFLAKEVSVIIVSLPSPKIIYDVLTEELFPALQENSYVLDMSTNDVDITRKLEKEAKEKEIAFFDCPVSGGPAGAKSGTLTIMVGGAEEKYIDILPTLETIGDNIEYIGKSGAGQIVKMCNNMMVGGIISLASEILKTGEGLGVSKKKITELMQKGSAQTKVMDVFGPSILKENFNDVNFSLANMMKDIELYQGMSNKVGVDPIISKSVETLYRSAVQSGNEAKDATVVFKEFSLSN